MKQIILLRHAKVDIANEPAMCADELSDWVKAYDHAVISTDMLPDEGIMRCISEADYTVCSGLRRSIDTAKFLGLEVDECDALFNEAKIPEAKIPFLKLKPKSWLLILRLLLILGFGKKETSLKASKRQANEAAKKLHELAQSHHTIVLVGHGGMNWLIRKALMRARWQLKPDPSHKNLGMTALIWE